VLVQRAKAELLLVAITLIWGSTFVIVKRALADAPPFTFLSVRFTLAGLLMLGFMARGRLPRRTLLPGGVLGVLLFTGYAFQTWGLTDTTPTKCAFITGCSVILVPLLGLFVGQSMKQAQVVGAAFGFVGLYFLVLPSGLASVNRGDVLTLLGAVAYSAHILAVGKYTRQHSFLHLAPGQIIVVGMLASLAVPLAPSATVHWTTRLVAAILVTAIFATAFAFGTQVWAQKYTPPSHTALIFALEPVFAAITSRVVTHEMLDGKVLVGALLVLAGIAISEVWGGTGPAPVEA
jgi:drug/metabolite transporter (DMT)-like permease